MIEATFSWLVATTVDVTVLIVAVGLVSALLGRWLSPKWSYALWCLVVVRLLLIDVPSLPGGGLADQAVGTLAPSRIVIDAGRPVLGDVPRPRKIDPTMIEDEAAATPQPDSQPTTRTTSASGSGSTGVPVFSAQPNDPETTGQALSSWSRWLIGVWLFGATSILLATLWRELRFRHRLRREPRIRCERLDRMVEQGRRALALRREVEIVISDLVKSPAVTGVMRPVLLMPSTTLEFTDLDLRNIVLHELSHVKHHDLAANWVILLVGAVHWVNPLVRWALGQLREARETVRDFDALAAQPDSDPIRYAQTFLQLITRNQTRRDPSPVVGFLRSRGEVRRRILMIRSFDRVSRYRSGVVGLALLVTLGWASLTGADRAIGSEASPEGSDRAIRVERQHPTPAWHTELQATLEQTVVDAEFEDTPLADFVSFVQATTGVNVVMTPSVASDDYFVEKLSTRGTPITQILRLALRPHDLDYALYDGAVLIGDRGEIPRHFDLRFYRVAELAESEDPEYGVQLMDLITQVVGAQEDEWDRDGARMSYWRGLLCVTQTHETHTELHRFLNMLLERGSRAEPKPPWHAEIEKKLGQKVEVTFEENPLEEALDYLTAMSGVTFVVDPEYGDESITLQLRNVTAGNVLRWICTLQHLRSEIRDGVVYLSDRERTMVRVYDARDLLPPAPESDGTVDLLEVDEEPRERLAELIDGTVRPGSWDEGNAAVHFFGRLLVVVQTEEVHAEIETFLASLRRAMK